MEFYPASIEDPLSPEMELLIFSVVIAVFATALLFFFMTLIKRVRRLREEKEKSDYQNTVENILFRYLFEELSLQEAIEGSDFAKFQKYPLFKRVAIKAIISLHDNYSGSYSKKLQHFFEESGLADYSVAKLESSRWPFIVEGIRDLSTLNHQASYGRIASRITHPHELVKTEVLLGLIKMRGIEEIMKFQKSGLRLNDWIQSNILYTVKKHKIPAPQNLDLMLKSSNRTIVLLAVRLMDYYKQAEHYETLSAFFTETRDTKLKREIALVLKQTEFIS